MQAKNSQKGSSQKFSSCFLMLSCVGVGHGWLQNIFFILSEHVRIQFRNDFFGGCSRSSQLTVTHPWRIYITKGEKRNFSGERGMNFMQKCFLRSKRQLKKRAGCDDKERENEFSSTCTGNLFFLATCITWRSKKEIRKEMKISSWLRAKSTEL